MLAVTYDCTADMTSMETVLYHVAVYALSLGGEPDGATDVNHRSLCH
jgi:hypothetical protein